MSESYIIKLTLILQSVRRTAVMSQEITNISSESVVVACSEGSCVAYRPSTSLSFDFTMQSCFQ